ncbi:hypothetical protein GCM10027614_15550 [Micromonospora vulcania]
MVEGIILTAVGFTLLIENPTGEPSPGWIAGITGGPALFLVARSAFEYLIFGEFDRTRLIGVFALVGIAVAVVFVSPVVTSIAATLVLAGIAISDAVRGRHRRSGQPAPLI